MKKHKTLFAVRVNSRLAREAGQLTGIILAMALGFTLFAAIQVAICKYNHPEKKFWDCIRPMASSFKLKEKT